MVHLLKIVRRQILLAFNKVISLPVRLDAKRKIKATKSGDYFVSPALPYYSQFASPRLVSDILDKKIKASDDPNWKRFGFKNKKDYEFWSWRLCGLICVKMIFDGYEIANEESVASLAQKGVDLGGYKIKVDQGWYHQPLVTLAGTFGLLGKVYDYSSTPEIAADLLDNRFSIASVHPGVIRFDYEKPPPGENGGHLVLVLGVKITNGVIAGFYVNNPSGRTAKAQQRAFIPIDRFLKAYDNRRFSIWK